MAGQMKHGLRFGLLKQPRHSRPIRQIAFDYFQLTREVLQPVE
jgi:hypothetical protein